MMESGTQPVSRTFLWRKLCAASLFVALLSGLQIISVKAAESSDSSEVDQQLQQVSQAIRDIEQWLQQSRQQRSAAEAALADTDRQLGSLRTNIAANREQQQKYQTELEQLDSRLTQLLADSAEQREQLASALEATYLAGADSQLKLLLNQQDPTTAQRMLVYFEAFNAEKLEQINRWRQTLLALESTRSELAQTHAQLEQTRAELENQQAELLTHQQQRQALIDQLVAEMSTRSEELSQLQQDQAELQALAEQINSALIDIPEAADLMPFTEARGNMPWPVSGQVQASFGQAYSNGQLKRQGLIIAAAVGTAVRAIHPGRVVFADWLRGSGNLVIVDHGNSYLSLYAHNQQLTKQAGDWVNRGEALALSGNNAGNGQPGLYLEIRRNSQPLDPALWLTPAR
jgi:murein hydrolase activator